MQRKDFYFKKAKQEGYLARSVYKLLEINKKYNLIEKNSTVLDLGCAPGSWIQACLKLKVKEVIGVDLKETKISNPNFIFLKEDITKFKIDQKFNVILSDLAPSTSGNKDLDSSKSFELGKCALNIVKKNLKENGNFVVKIFQGEEFEDLLKNIKTHFKFCKSYKPKSTRKESKEIYIIAKNYLNQHK
jgi:23S rRNA (uridine2552-2'-O)-methyltransferase